LCETSGFFYIFCETKQGKISMEKGAIFQWRNLDGERTKNYFKPLIFAEKPPKIGCFSAFLGTFEGFLFHMKHNAKTELFHVKHILLCRFCHLPYRCFSLFYLVVHF